MFWNFGVPTGMPTGQMPSGQGQMPQGQMPTMGTGLPTGQFTMPQMTQMPQAQQQGQFQVQDLQAQLQANFAAQAQLQAQMQAQAQQMQACSGQVWPGATASTGPPPPPTSATSSFMQQTATSPPPPPPSGGTPVWSLNTGSTAASPPIIGNPQVVGQTGMPPARQKGSGKGKHDRDHHRDHHHHRDHRDQHRDNHKHYHHHQSSSGPSGELSSPLAPRPNPNQEAVPAAAAAAAPTVAKRPPLSKQQRELRSGDFLVRRSAANRASNQVREVLTQTAASQRRIADVTKEIEGAKDKASKSQDLRDRAQASHAQHFYMMQEAERLFNEAAGSGAGAAGAAEALLEALAKCAANLGAALDTVQAILRKQDMMLVAEKSRQLVKQVESAVQRSMSSLTPAKQRITTTKDSHDAKGMATACQQVKTIVFQITLSAGSLMQGASLAQEVATSLEKKVVNVSKTKVQELSNMPGPARTPLPIDESRDEIVAAIKTRAVTCVQGETGCGKSSRVPQYIYSYCRGAAQYLRGGEGERIILCIQPRQLAAVSLAKHVAKEMGEAKVGGLVGYRTLGESCADSKKTKIMYISLDLLLQELLEVPGRIRGYSHIIFDEVHERSVDADLLSLFLKIHLQNRIADFKLIVMSATFEDGIYSNYFQDDNEVIAPPPALNAGGRNFDLDVLYLEDLLPFSKALDSQDDVCSLADELRQCTGRALQGNAVAALEAGLENFSKLMKQFKQLEKSKTQTTVSQLADFGLLGSDAESEFWRTHSDFVPSLTTCPAPLVFLRPQIQRGLELTTLDLIRVLAKGGESFLIILPGPSEVAEFYDLFLSLGDSSKMGCSLEVLTLPSGASTPSYSAALLEAPKEGTCRVYLASKAAESSLTLPKVKIAIDFCLRQATVQDQTRRQLELPLSQWTSRASTNQRGGRVGRSSAGLVLRMVPREFYEAVLPAYDTPDMEQASLQRLYLQLKVLSEKMSTSAARLGVLPPRRLAQLAVQPPVAERLENATRALVEAGALTHKSDDLGRLTILGRLAAMLPLELRFCRLLVFGSLFGCAADAVVMAVALQGQDPFTLPIGVSAAAFGGKAAAEVHADRVKELIKSTKSREFFDDGALSEAVMLRNLFMTWLRGLETPPPSETALSTSVEAFSLVPRSSFKRRSDDLAASHAVNAERLTELAVGVADVAKRMLKFLPPESAVSFSPARTSLQRLLADMGVCKRPASTPVDVKVGEGLFCQDLLLLKSALTAAYAPHVASGVVNCISQPPAVPAPRLAEGGGVLCDPDLGVLHHQLLRDPDRFGGGARHCFAIPQVSEALRQNSNTWLASMLDVLKAGKSNFKKMQIIQKDAFFLFDAGDSEEDSNSDLDESGSADEIQLPETLQEVPLFEEEAAPAKASALGLLKGYDTSDSESEGKGDEKSKKDKQTADKDETSKDEDEKDMRATAPGIDDDDEGKGRELAAREKKEEEKKDENSDDELARIEQALDMEERKALENSEQLQLKDERKSRKKDRKSSKAKDKDKKRKKKKRSRSRKNRRRSRSRSRDRRRSSRSRSRRRRRSSTSSSSESSSSSSRSDRKPKTSRPAARPAVSASQLARAAAAAAAAFATGKASDGAKQDLLAATLKEGKAAMDRRNPLLSMLRSGGGPASAASQGSVDTAFTALTDEEKQRHQLRLERLKAIQEAAEERQRKAANQMKIEVKKDSSSVMAKLQAREEKRKKREEAAARKKEGGAGGDDVVDISDSDEDKPPPAPVFAIGVTVRAEGLTSASGRHLNGQIGKITYLPEGGRVEVEFSGDRILSLRAANVKVVPLEELPAKGSEPPAKSSKVEEPKGSESPEPGESSEKPESGKAEEEKEKPSDPKAGVEMEADFMDFMNDINSMDQEAAAAEAEEKKAHTEKKEEPSSKDEDVKMEDIKVEVKEEEENEKADIKMEDVKKESEEASSNQAKAKPEEVKVEDTDGEDPPAPPSDSPPAQPPSPPAAQATTPPPPPPPAEATAKTSSSSASPRALPPALTMTSADLIAEAKRRALGQMKAEEPDPDDILAKIVRSYNKEQETAQEEKKDDDGLSDLPLVEIKRRARSAGITVGSHMNDKEELIGLIREANAAAAKATASTKTTTASTASSDVVAKESSSKSSNNNNNNDMEASFAAFMSDLGSSEAQPAPSAAKSTTEDDFQAFLQAVDKVPSVASPVSPPASAGTGAAKEEEAAPANASAPASSSKGGMDDAFSAFMSEIGGLGLGGGSSQPEEKKKAEAAVAAAAAAAPEPKPEPEAPLPEPSTDRPVILVHRPRQWAWLVRSLNAADKTFPIGDGGPIEARQQALKYCRERQKELEAGQQQGTSSSEAAADQKDKEKNKEVAAFEGAEVVCRGIGTNAMQLLKQLCGSCGGNGKSSPWPLGAEAPAPAHPFQMQWRVSFDGDGELSSGHRQPMYGVGNFRNPAGSILSCPSKATIEKLRQRDVKKAEDLAAAEQQAQQEHQAKMSALMSSTMNPMEATIAMQAATVQLNEQLATIRKKATTTTVADSRWAQRCGRLAVFAGPASSKSAVGQAALPLSGLTLLPTETPSSNALPLLLLLAFSRPRRYGGVYKGGCAALCDLDSKRLRAISLHGHREDARWVLPVMGKRRLTLADLRRANALREAISAALAPAEEASSSSSSSSTAGAGAGSSSSSSSSAAGAGNSKKKEVQVEEYLRENPDIPRTLGALLADIGLPMIHFDSEVGSAKETASAEGEQEAAPEAATSKDGSRRRQYGDVWIDLLEENGPALREPLKLSVLNSRAASGGGAGARNGTRGGPGQQGSEQGGQQQQQQQDQQQAGPFFSFESSVDDIVKNKDDKDAKGKDDEEDVDMEDASEKAGSKKDGKGDSSEDEVVSSRPYPTLTLPDAIEDYIKKYGRMRKESKEIASKSRAQVQQMEKKIRTLRAKVTEIDEGAVSSRRAWDLVWEVQDGDRDTVQSAMNLATHTLQTVSRMATEMAEIAQGIDDAINQVRDWEREVDEGMEIAPQFWKPVVKVLSASKDRLKLHDQVMRAALKRSDEPRAAALYQADLAIQLVNEKLRRWSDEEQILAEEAKNMSLQQEKERLARQTAELERQRQQQEIERQQQEMSRQREAAIQWGRPILQQPVNIVFNTPGNSQPPPPTTRGAPLPPEQAPPPLPSSPQPDRPSGSSRRK